MSPARFRPEMRLPWWALAGFAAVVYVAHSALRGWDFRPDAGDLIVFGALAVLLIARPLLHRFLDEGDDGTR